MDYDIRDPSLSEDGRKRTEWASREMPVLRMIKERFEKERPLEGIRISACLHVTSETANLMEVLISGGAQVRLCASNPLSTQDDVAAHIVRNLGIPVFAIKGEDTRTYYRHIMEALSHGPHITMDDGADLVTSLHSNARDLAGSVIGGTEETTTGVIRLRSMEREKVLLYPIIAVNDALSKHMFDNRYGTGQSTIDGIIRATNLLLAGTKFVVCGYGWCGKGIAMRARGMGANVIVTEVDPLRALEAAMDGFTVMPLLEAARIGKVFVTATGDKNVITEKHIAVMRDGAILANAGHFNVEIDIPSLRKMSRSCRRIRGFVEEFVLEDGRRIYLLAEGRLVNLSAAEGHPAAVMDMSFANQALSVEYIVKNEGKLEKKVYSVPREIDEEVALLKLKAMGIEIDELTEEQRAYLSAWEEGT